MQTASDGVPTGEVYNYGVVRRFAVMTVVWGVVGMLVGVVIAALLIANLGIGVISRAAPQMNIFAVGFPFTLLVGMGALYLTLPYFVPLLERLFSGGIESAVALLRGLAPAAGR